MGLEDGVELGAVDFTIDEVARYGRDIARLKRVFAPEQNLPATVMQVARGFGNEFRKQFTVAA